jgi:molybdate transport system substrate-binding protein
MPMKATSSFVRTSIIFAALASLLLLAACAKYGSEKQQVSPPEIIVAAASDLGPAFEELGKLFEQQNKIKVTFSFSSTGTLTQQIENHAPFDLFAAANVSYIDGLEKKGLILADSKALYATGRITIWMRADSPLKIERLEDLAKHEIQKVAIANPGHAPYGTAAREALQSLGVWAVVEPKLVLGENVRQAMQYAETGNVDVAITALSLSVQSKGRWVLIPQELHKPLDQALAVLKGTKHEQEARQFAAFINGPVGRPVMRKYGFILPGEQPIK